MPHGEQAVEAGSDEYPPKQELHPDAAFEGIALPTSQSWHAVCSELEAYFPGEQSTQWVAEISAWVPGRHDAQDVDPSMLLTLPTGHDEHAVVPSESEKRPTAHSEHASPWPADCFPTGHAWQLARSETGRIIL